MELADQFLIVSAAKRYIKANYLFGGPKNGTTSWDHNHISPFNITDGYQSPRRFGNTCRTHFNMTIVLIQILRSRASPLIATANEKHVQ
jgi:hypothetical protein